MRLWLAPMLLLAACSTPAAGGDAGAADAGLDAGPLPLDPVEYTTPTPILGPDGTVVAHGWARRPVFEYQRADVRADLASHVREWEYVEIFAPDFQASVTMTDIGFVVGAFLSVHDHLAGDAPSDSLLAGPGALTLPSTPFEATHFETPGGAMDVSYASGVRTIHYGGGAAPSWDRAEVSLAIEDDPSRESVATVVCFPPQDPGLFFYENKRVALPVSGTLRVGARTWTVPDGSLAVIDWGRGAWPSDVVWLWADAAGTTSDGHVVGINLGTVHGDDSHGTSDAVVVDGVLHKLGRVTWTYDPASPTSPWTFADGEGRLSLTLTPEHDASADLVLGPRSQHTLRMLGTYRGTVVLDDGTTLVIDGLRGAAEQVTLHW